MKVKYREIIDAYMIANAGGYGENTALLDKATGLFYFHSDYGDFDEIPNEIYESDAVIAMPEKNELDLGSRLVFRFASEICPERYDKIREIFSRRGAYGRYRNWLVDNDLLDKWYDYSNAAEEEALREWCADNEVELED